MFEFALKLADQARHRLRLRRWAPALARGRRGEDLAHRHLRALGYTVVARNWRLPGGAAEADIVAWEGDRLVFVEVKTRGTDEYGAPDRAIGIEKRRHILRAAISYARRIELEPARLRFDVVNVLDTDPPSLTLVRDAFRPLMKPF